VDITTLTVVYSLVDITTPAVVYSLVDITTLASSVVYPGTITNGGGNIVSEH